MKKLSIAFLLVFLSGSLLLAQNDRKFSISGKVLDQDSLPLVSATVMLLNAQDSILLSFSQSSKDGAFELKNIRRGIYLLQITYLGFQSFSKGIKLADKALHLGGIELSPQAETLEKVVVEAERFPMIIRKDTIEFNAESFNTQPNDVVEDLLKKLPGVKVERDGTIKAQGEEVKNVLVDGKEFFGKDPKIATKNLPAKAVNKVQIFDKKSDMAEFSGIDDGREEKTINLKLKEGMKKGYFGSAKAGLGTDSRFEAKTNINRFSEKQQLSFLGMGNNINEQGFTFEDYLNFSGGLQNMMSGGGGAIRLELNSDDMALPLNFGQDEGFMTTWAGGVNLNNEFNKNTELNGSYFYNSLNHDINRQTRKESFLPNQTYISEEEIEQKKLNSNHRLNFTLDHKIDSLQSLKLRSTFSYNNSDVESSSSSRVIGEKGLLENDGKRVNASDGEGLNLNTSLLYRRKFSKKGRFLSTDFSFRLRENDSKGNLQAINNFYSENGNIFSSDTLLQNNTRFNDQFNYGFKFSYTEPIAKRQYLEFNYSFQKNSHEIEKKVYDQGPENSNPIFNTQLSSHYDSDYTYNRPGVNFRVNRKKYNLSAGLSLQHSRLDGNIISEEAVIKKSFVNLLPNLRWTYDLATSKNFHLNYAASVREPSIEQLQPVVDNSDPFNIYVGNPDLKPEYSHNINLRYFSFSQFSMTNFFVTARFSYTTNKISESQLIDPSFVTTRQPLNVDNGYNLRTNINFGTPIKKLGIRVDINPGFTFNRGINFINGLENQTNSFISSVDISIENRAKDVFDIIAGANLSNQQTHYSIDSNMDQDFWDQVYWGEFSLNFLKHYKFSTSVDYAVYSGRSSGFNDNVAIWEASISRFFLKNKRGELTLRAVDLLDQNKGINRQASLNYVLDERTQSLGRYFMFSFTYALQGFGERHGGIKFIQRR